MTKPVGADIESLCRKCGDVWHVVMAKVGDKIVKVQCKQCGGLHRYRPLNTIDNTASKSKPASPSRPSRSKSSPAPRSSRREEPVVVPYDPLAPVRRYSPGESYEAGDHIKHVKFDVGVVEKILEGGKIQVVFPSGRKVLAQAKPASTLMPPNERILRGGE